MPHAASLLRILAIFAALLATSAAHAQLFRAYLSSNGSDSNNCTVAAPCRLLPAAINAVADGGEIWILNSANYNATSVSINKSLTILAVPGALGSLVATGTSAIMIATPGVKVALRNISIGPLPGANDASGIVMTAGLSLTLENCLIANLPLDGIRVETLATLSLSDTNIRDNRNSGVVLKNGAVGTIIRGAISGHSYYAIYMSGDADNTTTAVHITGATINSNNIGLIAISTNNSAAIKISAGNSHFVGNGLYALGGQSASSSGIGGPVWLSVSDNVIANNGIGIAAIHPGVKVWASGNMVSGNSSFGFSNDGGLFESAGNNALRNNATDTSGTINVIATR